MLKNEEEKKKVTKRENEFFVVKMVKKY